MLPIRVKDANALKPVRMIRIAITPAAYEAICSTLPKGAPLWPVQRQGGRCLVHVEAAVVDRLRAMRERGETYSDVIVRLAQLEASGRLSSRR